MRWNNMEMKSQMIKEGLRGAAWVWFLLSQICRGPSLVWEGVPKIKFAQNGLKYILVLDFLKYSKLRKLDFFATVHGQPTNQPDGHRSVQFSHSALEIARLKIHGAYEATTPRDPPSLFYLLPGGRRRNKYIKRTILPLLAMSVKLFKVHTWK